MQKNAPHSYGRFDTKSIPAVLAGTNPLGTLMTAHYMKENTVLERTLVSKCLVPKGF
jgi:hypothetical protein